MFDFTATRVVNGRPTGTSVGNVLRATTFLIWRRPILAETMAAEIINEKTNKSRLTRWTNEAPKIASDTARNGQPASVGRQRKRGSLAVPARSA
ncbi:hypothetical protein K2X85_03230 [bacterium]|nr:hypothetical protein [bacterium]